MTTANLSVGINTEKARADLNALKDFMRSQLSSMALSINEKSLEASIKRAMQGPTNGFALRINTAKLKTELSEALNDVMSGVSVGGIKPADMTKIKADLGLVKQSLVTAANEANFGERIAKDLKDKTPAIVKAAKEAGRASGNALAESEGEAVKMGRASWRVKDGAVTHGVSEPSRMTADEIKAKAESEALDKASLATQKLKNQELLRRIDMLRTEFDLKKKSNAEELKAFASSQAKAGISEMKARAQGWKDIATEAAKAEKAQRAAAARMFAEGKNLAPDSLTTKGKAKYGAQYAISKGFSEDLLPNGAAGLLQVTDGLEKGIKKVGQAHTEATGKTKAHTAAMHDAHSAARGLASGMGMMWLTWGNIAPLLAGASLSHGFIQAMKAGSEFAYQLTFVKAVSGETAEAVREIGQAALAMGKDSLYGPVEIANGLRILSQAGLSATEAISALPTVLNLATAGEMEMKDAALTLVGVMSAFGLHTRDLEHIGDVFAKAAAVSQTNVEQMTQAMKTASVVGEQYGASIEDTATALTLLAKVNITGTAAGTSFRNMLKELYAPTDKAKDVLDRLKISAESSTGSLRPFADIVYELKGKIEQFDKGSQVNILQRLFGERGAKEAIAMLSLTRKQWDELNGTISNSSGFLRDVSQQLEATTKGTLKQALNTLQVSMVEAFNASEGAAGKLAVQLKELFGSAAFRDTLMGLVSGAVSLTNALVQMAPVLATVAGGWVLLKGAMLTNELLLAVEAGVLRLNAALLAKGAAAAAASSSMLVVTNTATSLAPAVAGATAATAGLATGMSAFLIPLAAVVAAAGGLYLAYNKLAQSPDAEKLASDSMALASVMRNLRKETDQATAAILRQENAKANKRETVTVDTAINAQIAAIDAMKAKVENLRDVASTAGGFTAARAGLQIRTLTNEIEASEERLKDAVIERFRLQGQEASNVGRSYNLMLSDVQEKISGIETSIFQARKAATTPAEKSRINEQEAALNRIQDRLNSLKANASGITKGATTEVVRTLQNDLEKLVNEASMASGHMKMEFGKATKGAADSLGKIVQTEFNALKNASNAKVQLVKDEMQMRVRTEESGWEEIKKVYAEAAEEQTKLLAARYASATKPEERARIIKEIQDVAEASTKAASEVAKAFKKIDDEELKATQDYTKSLGATAEELLKKAKAAEEENAQIGMSAQQLEKLAQKRYEEALQIKNAEAARLSSLISEQQEVAVKEQAALVQALYNAGLSEEAAAAASSIPAQTEKEGLYRAQLFLVQQQTEAMSRLQSAEMARPKLKAQADEWKKFTDQIEQSLTDSLYRAFESGDSFGKAFAKSLQNTIKTAALKLTVQVVVGTGGNLVAQAADSVLGTKFSSSGSSLLGAASNVNSLYNTVSGGGVLGSLAGSSAAYGAAIGSTSIGAGSQAAMLAAQTGAFGVEGAAATAAAAGTISSEAAAAASGLASAASWALPAIGALTFVATNFKKIVGGQKSMGDGVQIVGSFNDGGFNGMMGQDWQKSGGWFGKKKNGMDWSMLSPEIDAAFDDLYKGVKTGLVDIGKRLGDDSVAGLLDGFTMQVDQRGVIQNVSGLATQIGNDLVKSMLSTVAPVVNDVMSRTGTQDWAGTLNTMTAQALGVDQALKLVGTSLEDTFGQQKLNDVLWVTDQFARMFGSVETMGNQLSAYVQNFYSESEISSKAWSAMGEQFAAIGETMPETKAGFRSLVESLDLTTESGRQTFASLMNLSPAFAQLAGASEALQQKILEQRTSWQNKLDVLTGATTDRQLQMQSDLASTTDAATQALIRQVYAQEDLRSAASAAAEAAAQAAAEAQQRSAAVASERYGLETQLLQAQGDTVALRERERAALDESNRALQDQIWALEDAKAAADAAAQAAQESAQAEAARQAEIQQQAAAAAQAAAAIASERDGLQKQLWQAQGDTVALRAAELAALNPANRALQQQIWLLEDQAAAAQKAAQIESERMGLQKQLWQLQGNTAAIRRAELEALDPSNRALQKQIWALEDSKKAADEWISTWENLSSSLLEQAKKLRGEISAQSSSSLMAQFATATAQARAGDSTAAGQLVGLSDQLMEAYNNTAGSSLEVARMAAYLAGSLETTANMTTALSPPTYRGTVKTNDNYSGSRQQAETTDEVRQLREENRSQAAAISRLLTELTRITSRWDRDGMPEIRAEAL